jgi:hypothetical protein
MEPLEDEEAWPLPGEADGHPRASAASILRDVGDGDPEAVSLQPLAIVLPQALAVWGLPAWVCGALPA